MNKFDIRSKFKLVIHLFYEGNTELKYLQDFIQKENKSRIIRLNRSFTNPNPITLVNKALKQYNDLYRKDNEVWVIFDFDDRTIEVREAIDLIKNSKKDIHVAFMKPCIEIWPLLHNNIDNVNNQEEAQSKLEGTMPSYKHDRYPYFDLNRMPNYEFAVTKASQWEQSLDGDPEYNASKFAGIYKLTEKIKNIK